MKTRWQPPRLDNYTPGAIVDLCAPETEEFNRLKKETDFLKTALKARVSEEFRIDPLTHLIKGEKYCAVISQETQSRFDVSIALEKGYLTEEQYAECFKDIPMTVVRFEQLNPPGSNPASTSPETPTKKS